MYLPPIALRSVHLDLSGGLWESWRALYLLELIGAWRARFCGDINPIAEADFVLELAAVADRLIHLGIVENIPENETDHASAA
jgi:hypothetical protein